MILTSYSIKLYHQNTNIGIKYKKRFPLLSTKSKALKTI